MAALWSYALAAVGITGLLIAANRPKVGWWFNIAAQTIWVSYAFATRQWGFLASALAYAVAYIRLLRLAYRPKVRAEHGPWFTARYGGRCSYCDTEFIPGDQIRADGHHGYLGECCGEDADA